MTQETLKAQLLKRIQSFLWRAGMMLAAVVVQFALDNLTNFNLSAQWTVLIGLVLGELSKWLNAGTKPEPEVA